MHVRVPRGGGSFMLSWWLWWSNKFTKYQMGWEDENFVQHPHVTLPKGKTEELYETGSAARQRKSTTLAIKPGRGCRRIEWAHAEKKQRGWD